MNWKVGTKYKLRNGGYATVVAIAPEALSSQQLVIQIDKTVLTRYLSGRFIASHDNIGDVLFEEYTEPKPKVLRAQYIVQYDGDRPLTTSGWYLNDEDVLKDYEPPPDVPVILTVLRRLKEEEFDQ